MHGCLLIVGLALAQASSPDLGARAAAIADRACDLDPFVREQAAREAVGLWKEEAEALGVMAREGRGPALLVLALAGEQDVATLLRSPVKNSAKVACHRLVPSKDQLSDVLRLAGSKDFETRIAACSALGRVEDPALRKSIDAALGHGMRRAGGADLVFSLVRSMWTGSGDPRPFLAGDADPERSSLAAVELCNVPHLELTESFAPALRRILENERIDRGYRSLLLHSLGRRSPSAFLPILRIGDPKFRSETVEVLDRALADPLDAPAVYREWQNCRRENLEDGRVPPGPLSGWLERWLKRLCGDAVTPSGFPGWLGAEYPRLLDRRADDAVRRGVGALKKLASPERRLRDLPGGLVGAAACFALAELSAGAPADDAQVRRCLDLLVDRDPENVYGASLAAMALGAAAERGVLPPARWETRARAMAELLVNSQLKSGGWSYVLDAGEATAGGWSYDLSNTQFSILGLRAAANVGAKVPRSTWEKALALLEKTQAPDGGWSYQGSEGPSYPRMTAAGACSWILCSLSLDETLGPAAASAKACPSAALRVLATAPLDGSPPDYYLLWSVERLCVISGIGRLGSRDWYAEGASILVRSQNPSGWWSGRYGPLADSCMALLFLRRAAITRPSVATGPAPRGPSEDEVREVFARRSESLMIEGVREVRPDRDASGGFIRVVVERGGDLERVRGALGGEVDGVPLRITLP